MSLLIARKTNEFIFIVGDTHVTEINLTHPIQKVSNPEDGVIKSIIINSHLCISFAGKVKPAEDAIRFSRKIYNRVDLILQHLLSVNKETNGDTEFIVCLGKPYSKLVLIKDKEITEPSHCWIGSKAGFNKFQENFLVSQQVDYLLRTEDSFKSVIQSSLIPEVSGFKISVTNRNGFFEYSKYIESYDLECKPINGNSNSSIQVITYGIAENGAYTVNIGSSSDNHDLLSVHILQGRLGILYQIRDGGLLYPEILKDVDEHEFAEIILEKFNLKAQYCISSKQKSFFERGNKAFENKDYLKAIEFYNKGLAEDENSLKAHLYFNNGRALFLNKNYQEAILEFDKAIKLNSSLQSWVIQFLNQKK